MSNLLKILSQICGVPSHNDEIHYRAGLKPGCCYSAEPAFIPSVRQRTKLTLIHNTYINSCEMDRLESGLSRVLTQNLKQSTIFNMAEWGLV